MNSWWKWSIRPSVLLRTLVIVYSVFGQTTFADGQGWNLVFKAAADPSIDPDSHRVVWQNDVAYNEDIYEARILNSKFKDHYKSSLALNWRHLNIELVKLSLLDITGNELISLIFNGIDSDRYNWFTKERLLQSPWNDIYSEPQNKFSAKQNEYGRMWHINRKYGGCNDAGWLSMGTRSKSYCDWENRHTSNFLYSKLNRYVEWNNDQDVGEASILAFFVKTLPELSCPAEWENYNKKCYYFNDSVSTWNEADVLCKTKGAQMLLLETDDEREYIACSFLRHRETLNWPENIMMAFLGCHKLSDKVTWNCESNGYWWNQKNNSFNGYWVWNTGQPDGDGDVDKYCLAANGRAEGRFHDRGCTSPSSAAICEKSIVNTVCRQVREFPTAYFELDEGKSTASLDNEPNEWSNLLAMYSDAEANCNFSKRVFSIGFSNFSCKARERESCKKVNLALSVIVIDKEDPVFTNLQTNISLSPNIGQAFAIVNWVEPNATDNSGIVTLTSSSQHGSRFYIGITDVTYTAVDQSGNTVNYTFTVTVTDEEAPLLKNIPENISIKSNPGKTFAIVTWVDPNATDNSGVVTVTSNIQPGSRFYIGSTDVTYTAVDPSGNTVNYTFTVTVTDEEAPTLTNIPENITIISNAGKTFAIVNWTEPYATDNSGVVTVASNIQPGSRFHIGSADVTYTAVDLSGNTVNYTFTVTVTDWLQEQLKMEINAALDRDLDYGKKDVTNHVNEFENVANAVNKKAAHVPEGESIYIKEQGIVAVIKSIPDYQTDKAIPINISLLANENEHIEKNGLQPSIRLSVDRLTQEKGANLTLIAVFSDNEKLTETINTVLNSDDTRNSKYHKQEPNHSWGIHSGLLNIQMLVNGIAESFSLDLFLPLKNKTYMKTSEKQIEKTVCVYWKPDEMAFSDTGVTKTEEGHDYVVCHSNHTTSFAVLLQITEVERSDAHQHILEKLTLVLTLLSILGLLITVLILLGFETLRRSERNIININFAVSLLAAQLVFLVAVDQSTTKIGCNVIAMTLHYLFLSAFGWMLVQGINLYYKIIKVYGAETNRMRYYLAIGWGLPALIVITSAGIKFESYASLHSCWLNREDGLIWAFAAPAGIVVLVNTLLLTKIEYILYTSANAMREVDDASGIRTSIKGALILTPLLGTTWVFGLLAVGDAAIVFQYLFVIGNCLQGVFIFAVCCLFNQEVRSVIKVKVERYRLKKRNLNAVDPIESIQMAKINSTVTNVTKKTQDFMNEDGTVPSTSEINKEAISTTDI